jgi:hypothetical protein
VCSSDLPSPLDLIGGLLLECLSQDSTNFWLRLHGTVGGDNYQLLSTSNLLNTNWDLGPILFTTFDGYTDFPSLPMTNAMTFFKAHHANPAMQIWSQQDSREPNFTNGDPGQKGLIYLQNEGSTASNVTVYYSIAGTAQNGIDYSNLTGVVNMPVGETKVEIDINPIEDGLKPDGAIVLTLRRNTRKMPGGACGKSACIHRTEGPYPREGYCVISFGALFDPSNAAHHACPMMAAHNPWKSERIEVRKAREIFQSASTETAFFPRSI